MVEAQGGQMGSYGCFWNLIKEATPQIDHVGRLVAA